jgi:hypothetical protein
MYHPERRRPVAAAPTISKETNVKRAFFAVAACATLCTVFTLAQTKTPPQTPAKPPAAKTPAAPAKQAAAAPAMPKPGPEVQRLAYFIGTWKTVGTSQPGPMGPGGKSTATEKCEWLPGGFFAVFHSDGTGPSGPEKSIGIMGYDAAAKTYTYHAFDNTGNAIEAKGQVSGDTWNWTSESKMGPVTASVRVTIKEVSKTQYTFKLEMSQDGKTWATSGESTSTKVTPAAGKN